MIKETEKNLYSKVVDLERRRKADNSRDKIER